MTVFDDYASYLDEDYHQDQQEMNENYKDAGVELDRDDDDYNDNHHDIEKEEPL